MTPRRSCAALLLALLPAAAPALDWGVNLHGTASAAESEQVAALMMQRNLKTARVDLLYDRDPAALRDLLVKIRASGGRAQLVVQVGFQWDHGCRRDIAAIEQDAHRETAESVARFDDLVDDFELLNEAQMRPEIVGEVAPNTARGSTAPYRGKPCVASLAAALRGMSHAIAERRQATGRPTRIVLGLVGRDIGFLRFMQENGVRFDVVGFHAYPRLQDRLLATDPWYGPGGPLAQLAAFGRPVRINEINCGEIYDPVYRDQADDPLTRACLHGLARHLKGLRAQGSARLEAIHVYELLDEPAKPPPENRFGLLTRQGVAKPQLALVAALAGGALSATERHEITCRGLLTHAEIAAMAAAAGPAGAQGADCRESGTGWAVPTRRD